MTKRLRKKLAMFEATHKLVLDLQRTFACGDAPWPSGGRERRTAFDKDSMIAAASREIEAGHGMSIVEAMSREVDLLALMSARVWSMPPGDIKFLPGIILMARLSEVIICLTWALNGKGIVNDECFEEGVDKNIALLDHILKHGPARLRGPLN